MLFGKRQTLDTWKMEPMISAHFLPQSNSAQSSLILHLFIFLLYALGQEALWYNRKALERAPHRCRSCCKKDRDGKQPRSKSQPIIEEILCISCTLLKNIYNLEIFWKALIGYSLPSWIWVCDFLCSLRSNFTKPAFSQRRKKSYKYTK